MPLWSVFRDKICPAWPVWGARVTKFARLAKIRAFWAVWCMQGEFCPVLAASKLSGESFVPRPGWRPLHNLRSAAVRCWDWSPRPWVGSSQASTCTRIGNEHADSLLTYPDAHNLSACAQPIRIVLRRSALQGRQHTHRVSCTIRSGCIAEESRFQSSRRWRGPAPLIPHAIRLRELSTKSRNVAIPTI